MNTILKIAIVILMITPAIAAELPNECPFQIVNLTIWIDEHQETPFWAFWDNSQEEWSGQYEIKITNSGKDSEELSASGWNIFINSAPVIEESRIQIWWIKPGNVWRASNFWGRDDTFPLNPGQRLVIEFTRDGIPQKRIVTRPLPAFGKIPAKYSFNESNGEWID